MIHAKQLNVLMGQAKWNTTGFTIPAGPNIDVSTHFSGKSPGGSDVIASVYTNPPQNKVFIREKGSGKAFEDDEQRSIFARLTESGGVWSLSFYVLNNGSEQSFDFTGHDKVGVSAEFRWCETVQVKDVNPTSVVDFGEGIDEINASNPLAHQHIQEERLVTAQDTVTPLSHTPFDINDVILSVNGVLYQNGFAFTIGGTDNKEITWVPGAAGFHLETTDKVIAYYQY